MVGHLLNYHIMPMEIKTKEQAREEYNKMRKDDPAFAECWSDDDHDFYEWCSGYTDYNHITRKGK
mgnify:FL=1